MTEYRARIPYMPNAPVYLELERLCTCCNGKGEMCNMAGYAALQRHEPIAEGDKFPCGVCNGHGWVPVQDLRIAVHVEGMRGKPDSEGSPYDVHTRK